MKPVQLFQVKQKTPPLTAPLSLPKIALESASQATTAQRKDMLRDARIRYPPTLPANGNSGDPGRK